MAESTAHLDTFVRDNLPAPGEWPTLTLDALPELAAIGPRVNCATALLDAQAAARPDATAIICGDQIWSYGELAEKANRIANVLVEDLGVVPGGRVFMRTPNNAMGVACWWAAMKAGAVMCATMPLLRSKELSFIADKARIPVALCDKRLAEEMEATLEASDCLKRVIYFCDDGPDSLETLMAEKSPEFENVDTAGDDPCVICFTSGTTGQPKGCVHAHRDVLAICETVSRHVVQPTADDVFAGSPPIAFAFGLGALVAFPTHAGASTVFIEQFSPPALLEAIQEHGITTLFTAPTAYRAVTGMLEGYDVSSLRTCVSAGETLPLPTWEAWRDATGLEILDGIGTSELLHIFLSSVPGDVRPGSTGKAVPGYEAKIIDDDGNDIGPDEVGRLAVRGPTGVSYLDNTEKQTGYVVDGWNVTGDAYLMDADGYFWFQSRTDDLIISSGYNISGEEVEAVLIYYPEVAECAVIGAPDEDRGQIVKAYIVLAEGAEAGDDMVKALQDRVKADVAPYKYPRGIEFIDALPRTATGKVQRYQLRKMSGG